ncbi:MAG: hypothetical protein GX633_08110 [Clostridiales bacterium]|nr:hypothetical protein [Clostridiales bacterium]
MKAGFARLDVTPPFGARISGYFGERIADGIITPLEANAVAFSDGENTAVIISLDIIGICQKEMDIIRKRCAENNGIPYEAVFIACTHTHTGPEVSTGRMFKIDPAYNEYLFSRISDAASIAIADMKEAALEAGRGEAKGISFVRRYRMADGSTKTNPGRSSGVVGPIGTPDEMVQLFKFVRKDAPDIAVINFQVHPDVIGGTKLCSDFPGFVRQTFENAMQTEKNGMGVHCVYFNGAQGDVNHVNINALHRSGLEHSRHMGRSIAAAAMQVYRYTEPINCDKVYFGQKSLFQRTNKGTPEQVAEAKAVFKLHDEDYEGYSKALAAGEKIMPIAQALAYIRGEQMPDIYELYLTCVGIGDLVFAGLPGEPFTVIGRGVKAGSLFKYTVPCCCANGYEGYFPVRSALEEGGYEAISCRYKPGVAESLIETSVELIKEIRG